jgi:hypothetical protein
MKHLKLFEEFSIDESIDTAAQAADFLAHVERAKVKKRANGFAIVKSHFQSSDTLLNIKNDISVRLNSNAIEPGGLYKFKNYSKLLDFSMWYLKEIKKILKKATSGDNSALAAKFKAEVEKKSKEINETH